MLVPKGTRCPAKHCDSCVIWKLLLLFFNNEKKKDNFGRSERKKKKKKTALEPKPFCFGFGLFQMIGKILDSRNQRHPLTTLMRNSSLNSSSSLAIRPDVHKCV